MGAANIKEANVSFRCADLASLFKSSAYPSVSWQPVHDPGISTLPNVIWSSFCTAYFHPNISTVLRDWAINLLETGGLMCLVDIQGLFSAHGFNEDSGDSHTLPADAPSSEKLFRSADESIKATLQNDVFA